MISFILKLLGSIFGADILILFFGIATILIGRHVKTIAEQVEDEVKQCVNDPNKRFAEDLSQRLNTYYNFFTTMITIFPLLGMLGTVKSLIELNLATEEMSALQGHFFDALTSTAWGIIFAIGFKLWNAHMEFQVTSQIEAAQKILERESLLTEDAGEEHDEK